MDGPFMICLPLFIPLMILFFKLNIYVISPKWDFCIAFLIVFLTANYIISKLYERNNRREQVLKHFKKTLWGCSDGCLYINVVSYKCAPTPIFHQTITHKKANTRQFMQDQYVLAYIISAYYESIRSVSS